MPWSSIEHSTSNVHDPRALAEILEKAEARLATRQHVDPVIREASLFVLANYDTQSGNSANVTWRHEMVRFLLYSCWTCADAPFRERNLPVCIDDYSFMLKTDEGLSPAWRPCTTTWLTAGISSSKSHDSSMQYTPLASFSSMLSTIPT